MRKVFSSLRLETVEGVAELLEQHGIDTRIRNGRSYKGSRRRHFSYVNSKKGGPRPASVWIVHPDDQVRAREILRAAGLLETTRPDRISAAWQPSEREKPSPNQLASRARMWAAIAVVVLGSFTVLRSCNGGLMQERSPATTPVPATPEQLPNEVDEIIVPIQLSVDPEERTED